MGATPCMLVAIISQVLHDFDTYGLDSAYSSLLHSFVYAIRTYVVDICGMTTWFVGLPPIWIYVMVYALHFIFIVFACVWVVRGYMPYKPMGHTRFSLKIK